MQTLIMMAISVAVGVSGFMIPNLHPFFFIGGVTTAFLGGFKRGMIVLSGIIIVEIGMIILSGVIATKFMAMGVDWTGVAYLFLAVMRDPAFFLAGAITGGIIFWIERAKSNFSAI